MASVRPCGASDANCQMSGIRCQGSDVRDQMSGIRCQETEVRVLREDVSQIEGAGESFPCRGV
ncbi:MAG: hypothetical protein LBI62_02410 [Candidatus Accumulibacter sp.]|nr:hypothetical protein [Accumulibacter sp.]